ncbi:MAG TPA: hydantoinase/oxoprolinase family protein [Terracidiphilus sp.]|jgi:N-methylhydantoinase A|nr:hydantoinase/oxoprolinase family protein [Terracidiphilus sp.]
MTPRPKPRILIAIDTGGTFTDCVFRVGGRVDVLKLPSTPDDPARAVSQAIQQIAQQLGAADVEIRHGTTVGTNALLERKGARVAFVTTEGFEDTLAIGRQARPSLYDWNEHRAEPLALPECCFGVAERVTSEGAVLRSPDRASLEELRAGIRNARVESVAVSLLFSFVAPAHEEAVAAALASLGLPISLSHKTLPEFREFERASTVTLNAYIAPKMQSYIRRIEESLENENSGPRGRLYIMQSSGGILSAKVAAAEPVRTILSGPAGGVIGALNLARRARIEKVLSFDMGGTSTDVALLDTTRHPATSTEGQVAGLPVGIPMLDIHTAGAGGGSLAWMDSAGMLQVGPQSAGADPGPACYGRGNQVTVTDADLVLGRLHSEHFLGGAMRLDLPRAHHVIASLHRAAKGFGRVEDLAEGVVRVANVHMESALRRVSVERGFDPRNFTLLAFGGAGPLHACELAEALGMRSVLIPSAPGALSALGILDADLRREYSRTAMLAPGSSQIPRMYHELEEEARAAFRLEGAKPELSRIADMRYQGQGFELQVQWSAEAVTRFHKLHSRAYGYADQKRPVEIVTLRVHAVARTHQQHPRAAKLRTGDGRAARIGKHAIFEMGKWRQGWLMDRSLLRPGDRFAGPAIIVELSATCFLAAGWFCAVDGYGNLLLTPDAKAQPAVRRGAKR